MLRWPAPQVEPLIAAAMSQRPEIRSQKFAEQAARRFETATWEQALPDFRALGTVGQSPVRDPHITSWFGAVGVNVQLPIFTGFRISSEVHQARLQTQAEDERLRGLQEIISRDVHTSWLSASSAYRRLSVTAALLKQTRLALDLAQTRYTLGLSSIVEVSEAQLHETEAEIGNARARYDYLLAQEIIRFEIGNKQ